MKAHPDQLLRGLQAGDDRAREQLYRDYSEQVLGWTIRLGSPDMDAEDLAHEVFVVALEGVHGFRGEASLGTWLFAITRRVMANARRRRAFRRFVGLERVAEPASRGRGPEQHARALERRRWVQQALEGLSRKHREVLVLVELEQRPTAEAAWMLGVPVGTVHSRLHSGRRALAARLRRLGWDEREGVLRQRVVPLGRGAP